MTVPNPVQRRFRHIAADDLIAPCAQEGGTFRDESSASMQDRRIEARRQHIRRAVRKLGWFLAVAVIIGVTSFASWNAHAMSSATSASRVGPVDATPVIVALFVLFCIGGVAVYLTRPAMHDPLRGVILTVEKVTTIPGDVVVFTTPSRLSDEQRRFICASWERLSPKTKAVVLDGGLEIATVLSLATP